MLSLLACGNYVCETYESTYETQAYFKISEQCYTILFTVDFCINLLIAKYWYLKLFSFGCIIDICTVIPVYVQWALTDNYATENKSAVHALVILRFFRIFGLIKIFNARIFQVMFNFMKSDILWIEYIFFNV